MSSSVRLARSVWPLVCGWNAVDIASLVPMVRNRLCQNLLVNLASRSETMDVGRPWRWKMLSKKILAVSGAVAVVREGTRWTILEKVSTKTTMASKPDLVQGSCMMKSMETCSQGCDGIGRGCRRPAGDCWLALILWQESHDFT